MEPLLQEGLNVFDAAGLSDTSIKLVGWAFVQGHMNHTQCQVMEAVVKLGAGKGLLENILGTILPSPCMAK